MSKRYLYFTVFISGMTTLAVELTASRLLGVVFGTSNLVWASIIGLMLMYLTVGYFLGGRWADKSPHPETMYKILAWGAFTAGLVPLASKPVLPFAAQAFDSLNIGVLAGAFAGVLILFSVPVTLLGTMSPFAIRLAIQDRDEAGTVSGRVYAISTLGSFVGTFLPVLILIPLIGTAFTFLTFSLVLTLVALLGLWLYAAPRKALTLSWMPIVLILLAVFWGNLPFKTTAGQIYETESAYNYIEVLQDGETVYLRLNEGQGIHSVYHPDNVAYYGPWMQFLAAPFFNPNYTPSDIERIAIVGLAAGTFARQATVAFGQVPIDGFEIDPEIIEVGRKYFNMTEENLNAIPLDGRIGLEKSEYKYSLIALDAYRPPYIPWHLTTAEFFQIVYDSLLSDGAMAINVGRAPDDRALLEGLVGTISTIFPSVYVMDIPGTFNSIVYATVQPTKFEYLQNNFIDLFNASAAHPLLLESMKRAFEYNRPTPVSDTVFTDDLAPIEWITNNMVLSFILAGRTDEIR